MQLLLDRSVDVDTRDAIDYTLLHIAAEIGRSKVAELLLNRGANIEAREKEIDRYEKPKFIWEVVLSAN